MVDKVNHLGYLYSMHEKNITEIRAFNRFYTNILGLLDQHVLDSRFSLPEARILYELYHTENLTASDVMESLQIDKGYLSRLLRQFEKQKLISKKRSGEDARSTFISLTKAGRNEFAILNEASNKQLKEILDVLTASECEKLVRHMSEIKKILSRAQQK